MLKYIEYITEKAQSYHPFILAAKKGNASKVKEFIKSGVDINIKSAMEGRTALMYASLDNFLIVVNALIGAGADVNLTDYENRTALMMASTNSIFDKILSVDNINVNIQNKKGETIIMEHINDDPTKIINIIERLLKKGLNLDIKNNNGKNFYDLLKDKIENVNWVPSFKLQEFNEIEKYMDDHFPQYKEEWDLKNNILKYNI